jgi:methyl-accepting chemotaxis protein
MVVHPTKPELEGTPTLGMADSTGFRFIKAMNDLVSAQKQGWVAYLWPKPGTRTEAPKISFVKQVMIDGRPYVVGCGMYDVTPEAFRQKYPSETLVTSN